MIMKPDLIAIAPPTDRQCIRGSSLGSHESHSIQHTNPRISCRTSEHAHSPILRAVIGEQVYISQYHSLERLSAAAAKRVKYIYMSDAT